MQMIFFFLFQTKSVLSLQLWSLPGNQMLICGQNVSIMSSLETVRAQFVKDLPPITEILWHLKSL